jgi:hypothetical protein
VANAAAASSPFLTEHADIIGWLDVLLKGKVEDQARARTEIAMILEERGFADDAEEAYWTNIQANAADRRAYERLIALYQGRKDRLSESLVRRKMEQVLSTGATPLGTETGKPWTPAALPAAGQATAPAAKAPASRAPSATSGQDGAAQSVARPVRRLKRAARQAGNDSRAEGRDNPRRGDLPAPAARQVAPVARAATPGAPAAVAAARTAAAPQPHPNTRPTRAQAPAPVQHAQSLPVNEAVTPAASAADSAQRRHRYAALSPNPGKRSWRPPEGLIVLQPATIAAFLLASVGAAAVISFIILAFDRGGVVPVAAASAQTGQSGQAGQAGSGNRCSDASARFPGVNDPRAAVVAAYKQQGIDVDAPKPGGPRLTADQAELVVGGWMAVSLLMEHSGQPSPSLAQWLDPGSNGSTLANAILAGRGLDSMLTHEEWSDMRSWPSTTCEGAFTRDPRNAGPMKQIERVVTK